MLYVKVVKGRITMKKKLFSLFMAVAMIATLAIRNLMRQGKAQQIDSAIMTGGAMGMQTMKKSIGELLSAGKIDTETAERYFYKESNGAS